MRCITEIFSTATIIFCKHLETIKNKRQIYKIALLSFIDNIILHMGEVNILIINAIPILIFPSLAKRNQ